MNSTRCFVLGCPNSEGNTTNATFYEFPEELQEEWLVAIGRSRDTFIIEELVCSEHFTSNDFESDTIKTLKRSVLPTLNLPAESEESLLTPNPPLNTSTCEDIEQLVKRCNSLEKSKPIKISSNAVCTVLKPKSDKTYEYETAPLNTINVILFNDESEEQPRDVSPVKEPEHMLGSSDELSEDEYHLEYEDMPNCRTCLDHIDAEGGCNITEIHHENKTVREMIVFCIPQMAPTLLETDLVCGKCLESIKFCVGFIESCLKVEMELHDSHLSPEPDENNVDLLENDLPEKYRHISLDHNYIPDHLSFDDNFQEVIYDPSVVNHQCLKCDKSFKTKNYLLDHIRRLHGSDETPESKKRKAGVFHCEFCEKSFMTKLGYDLHQQLSHGDRQQEERRKEPGGYRCRDCLHWFPTLGALSEHKVEEHGLTCKVCFLRFDTMTDLNAHYDTHPSGQLCHVCGKGFRNGANLKAHMHVHNDPNTHLCHNCGRGFKSRVSLGLHLKHHDPELKFRCDECPASFQQRHTLDQHKKVRHLGIREYKCTVCSKKFCYKANLKSHYKLKHSEVKPYKCEQCGMKFARSDYLKRHTNCSENLKDPGFRSHKRKYRYRRGDPAPITCKLCEKVFKDVQMLRLHIRTHTKLRKYKCDTCNLTFTTSSNRDRHEKVHAGSSFRCKVCFKRLETKEELDEHCAMSHENSKKYKCHVCDESFGRKYLLHSHVAERHEDVAVFEKEQEVLYQVVMQDYLVDN